jgi:uncharacterized protein (TIGR02246 family)
LFASIVVLALASTTPGWLHADQSEDEIAIRKAGTTYVEAFNNQDAKTIAALWSPDAVYMNPKTGEKVTGRAEIEQQLVQIFAESKDTKLNVSVDSVRFVSPSVAVEEGTASVLRPGAEPDVTVYSAVYIKTGGNWLLDRMSEEEAVTVPSNYEYLKDLQWMIGTWVDESEQATIETNTSWTKNQNFILQKFAVSVEGEPDLAGIQLIGWDPVDQKIRSWVFDSDGGFGTSTWKEKENKWIVSAAATLPDGRKASAIRTFTLVDDKTISWEVTGRALDGEILPNIDPIKLTRKTDSE